MIGKPGGMGDKYRADLIRFIKGMGRLSQVTLSLDLCRWEALKSGGGYGYAHLFEAFLPRLWMLGYEDCGLLPHAEIRLDGSYRDYHRLVKML